MIILRYFRGMFAVLFSVFLIAASLVTPDPARGQPAPHVGYGVQGGSAEQLGFDWVKLWSAPGHRLPYRVLVHYDLSHRVLDRLDDWGDWLENTVRQNARYVEAWEIGNEPNLDADYGWGAPPNASDYVRLLREAYIRIKRADPSAIVVSAGLAPTGRIPFTWNGHKGYCAPGVSWCPIYYQDEREFLREMLREGAANYFDALGYHPYGFSAPYDAALGSIACGPNDFCFRGVEVLRQIMIEEFGVNKPIWATEFGWIVDPRQVGHAECWNDPSMVGFQWMAVSPEVQANNLRGAYQWADEHYPWMEGMFFFNSGFCPRHCDQICFFNINIAHDAAQRLAVGALQHMNKNIVPLRIGVVEPVWLMADATHTQVRDIRGVRNLGLGPLRWQAEVADASFPLSVSSSGDQHERIELVADARGLPVGVYRATLRVSVTSANPAVPVENPVQNIPVTLRVISKMQSIHFPFLSNQYHY